MKGRFPLHTKNASNFVRLTRNVPFVASSKVADLEYLPHLITNMCLLIEREMNKTVSYSPHRQHLILLSLR